MGMLSTMWRLTKPGGAVKVGENWFPVAIRDNPLVVWVGKVGNLGTVEYADVEAIKSPLGDVVWKEDDPKNKNRSHGRKYPRAETLQEKRT